MVFEKTECEQEEIGRVENSCPVTQDLVGVDHGSGKGQKAVHFKQVQVQGPFHSRSCLLIFLLPQSQAALKMCLFHPSVIRCSFVISIAMGLGSIWFPGCQTQLLSYLQRWQTWDIPMILTLAGGVPGVLET